jgi:hypothetical protein
MTRLLRKEADGIFWHRLLQQVLKNCKGTKSEVASGKTRWENGGLNHPFFGNSPANMVIYS